MQTDWKPDLSANGEIVKRLLSWYDRHGRDLAWRVRPLDMKKGRRAHPYRVWLSEIMLQQTTVVVATPYFEKFIAKWPTVEALASAPDDEVMAAWAGLGYYARARNLIKTARIIADEFGGAFPETYDQLIKLPGIGPYTGAAIATIAFGKVETVVDGNVERVLARVFALKTPLPTAKKQLYHLAKALTPQVRPGDYAQAVMDLGAMICRPARPDCKNCPLSDSCRAFQQNCAQELPHRLPKAQKPTRYAHFFVARRADGAWILERRAQKGLLGGMLAWPSSPWDESWPPMPDKRIWQQVKGEIRHTFTHFHLIGKVFCNKEGESVRPTNAGIAEPLFLGDDKFSPKDLPSLMRKAYFLTIAERGKS